MDNQEIKFLLSYLISNGKYLNSLQHEFLASSKKTYNATGVLTQRQVECLYDLKDNIPAQVIDETVIKSESDLYQAQYSSFDHLSAFNV